MSIIPVNSKNPSKGDSLDDEGIPAMDQEVPFDLELDEDEVLKRYDTVFRTFVSKKVLPPLSRRYTEKDVGKNIQGTIIDWSVCHALQGSTYIEETQVNMQYTVLQSALILTISMPLYISPPDFNNEDTIHIFSAVVGGAAFCQLVVIISCTIMAALLNRPFSSADSMVVRVEAHTLYVTTFVMNYIANCATVSAMYVAGFDRSFEDGAIQLYGLVFVIIVFALFLRTDFRGKGLQDKRALLFYEKYCEENGRLKKEFLRRLYCKKKDGEDAV